MFKTALIVDNDRLLASSVKKKIEEGLNIKTSLIDNLYAVNENKIEDVELYIIRLTQKTESLIEKLADEEKNIIILTNKNDPKTIEKISTFNIADYATTSSINAAENTYKTVERLHYNSEKRILIVDDSKLVQLQVSMLLDTQNIQYIKCDDGQIAWDYLNNPDSEKIDLVITDYQMPNMNGEKLVEMIRTRFSMEELPVLVLSGNENHFLIANFLKLGANDYISKPFVNEEFIARVSNYLSMVYLFRKITDMALTDYLTGINNRVYFYQTGSKVLDIEKRANATATIAMMDIDNFKKVNDTYGHEVGDKALINVAKTIQNSIRASDIVARFGGEEFVVLLPNCPLEEGKEVLNKVCKAIEDATLRVSDDVTLTITVSIGLSTKMDDINAMIEEADSNMYISKNSGKNRVTP